MTINIGVLVSGRGSNLQSIIDNIENGSIPDSVIKVVISDVEGAYALERAKKYGIEAVSILPGDFADKSAYEAHLLCVLQGYGLDLVLLAGYMRIIGSGIISEYKDRIMNIHPALLPAFKGLHAQRQAFEYGVKVAGCTVHFVDEGMDTGPIIIQRCVEVLEDDDEDTLAARILEKEHIIFPEAVRLFAQNRLKVEGRRVYVL